MHTGLVYVIAVFLAVLFLATCVGTMTIAWWLGDSLFDWMRKKEDDDEVR